MSNYQIVRFYRESDRPARRVMGGLTLAEAQTHCKREDTHGGAYCPACNLQVADVALTPASADYPKFCQHCGGATAVEWFEGYDIDEGANYRGKNKRQKSLSKGGRR